MWMKILAALSLAVVYANAKQVGSMKTMINTQLKVSRITLVGYKAEITELRVTYRIVSKTCSALKIKTPSNSTAAEAVQDMTDSMKIIIKERKVLLSIMLNEVTETPPSTIKARLVEISITLSESTAVCESTGFGLEEDEALAARAEALATKANAAAKPGKPAKFLSSVSVLIEITVMTMEITTTITSSMSLGMEQSAMMDVVGGMIENCTNAVNEDTAVNATEAGGDVKFFIRMMIYQIKISMPGKEFAEQRKQMIATYKVMAATFRIAKIKTVPGAAGAAMQEAAQGIADLKKAYPKKELTCGCNAGAMAMMVTISETISVAMVQMATIDFSVLVTDVKILERLAKMEAGGKTISLTALTAVLVQVTTISQAVMVGMGTGVDISVIMTEVTTLIEEIDNVVAAADLGEVTVSEVFITLKEISVTILGEVDGADDAVAQGSEMMDTIITAITTLGLDEIPNEEVATLLIELQVILLDIVDYLPDLIEGAGGDLDEDLSIALEEFVVLVEEFVVAFEDAGYDEGLDWESVGLESLEQFTFIFVQIIQVTVVYCEGFIEGLTLEVIFEMVQSLYMELFITFQFGLELGLNSTTVATITMGSWEGAFLLASPAQDCAAGCEYWGYECDFSSYAGAIDLVLEAALGAIGGGIDVPTCLEGVGNATDAGATFDSATGECSGMDFAEGAEAPACESETFAAGLMAALESGDPPTVMRLCMCNAAGGEPEKRSTKKLK